MEDGTFIFQLAAQLDGVGQVAVVAQCHGAAAMAHDHGLCVGPHAAACRGVAHVTGSHVRIGVCQTCQHRRGEHLVHKAEVAVAVDHAIIVHGDAAALLTTVLQGIQSRVGRSGHILGTGTVVNAENAAFFVQRICKIRHWFSFFALKPSQSLLRNAGSPEGGAFIPLSRQMA